MKLGNAGVARTLAVSMFGVWIGLAVAVAGAGEFGMNARSAASDVERELGPQGSSAPAAEDRTVALIRSTIMAIHHANQTGNYSVLRDLGTPKFRERFDQAQLTAAFAGLRGSNADLTPVLAVTPALNAVTQLAAGNELHAAGDFSARTLRLRYDFTFAWIGGQWRIERLALDAVFLVPVPGNALGSTSTSG